MKCEGAREYGNNARLIARTTTGPSTGIERDVIKIVLRPVLLLEIVCETFATLRGVFQSCTIFYRSDRQFCHTPRIHARVGITVTNTLRRRDYYRHRLSCSPPCRRPRYNRLQNALLQTPSAIWADVSRTLCTETERFWSTDRRQRA